MRCIVLGASGQLGREWIKKLNESESSTFDYVRGFNSAQLDITDRSSMLEVIEGEKPDVVVNCAAYTRVDEAEKRKEIAEKINCSAVRQLAEMCRSRDIKLVHYSTDYVFPGRKEDRQRFPGGYPEDHQTSPVNWYGATKLKGEQAIRQSGAAHLIIRVSWLCGQFGGNFVKTMLKLAGERDELDVVNDQWGSPSFTENVVENSMILLKENSEGTFNVTSKGITNWHEFACRIFEIMGKDIQVNAVTSDAFETVATRPSFSKLSTDKLARVKGAKIVSWEQGLQRLLNQLKAD
ncbi:dTDP-4-dehydrorhamnose reductase [Aliifodinibius sp. S!AR15-10]|uniref:dTDP-4-dehydrorhamnose reductase n=1 Tax=Aliifodinibius sp. S!AR15-10 TaxID=2950437 RepID=UPI00285F51DE|nr:dTDP-4-dehydrorhamnose reductase [Aliifodinibius sp. S!AR15-10]MDR8390848.1 dTDP-4-dehydrorhamnose reductase [Aliifodinibius sp. S!AR15-10]